MADELNKSALEKRIKKHLIGKPHRFMAVAPLGFEKTLMDELLVILGTEGAAEINVAGDGKVEFVTKLTEAWKVVAYSRIANRVLMEIDSFKAENFGQLEKGVSAVPWELYLPHVILEGGTPDRIQDALNIHVTCKHSRLYHSDAVEERVRKVINVNDGPAESPTEMQQHLYVNLLDDRCTLWLDLAGEELYKRGHERFVAEAPLKETIAAAMIFEASKLTTNHQPLTTILDPMAGSGTFSLEAAYIANGLIPGKCRDFALKHQPAFKEATWNYLLKAADRAQSHPERSSAESKDLAVQQSGDEGISIITSDISQRPIDILRHNAEVSPLPAGVIDPQLKDFFSYTLSDFQKNSSGNVVILLNPPYGKRLAFDAPKLYTKIGKKLNEFKGCTVAILVPKDCMSNLIRECPALDSSRNFAAKTIETSHGGFSLNAIFAKI
ncbi:class I SAM-dependent RNA methyltransferase [Fibrobacter sp. UWEL]|uniref:THUMP domain-containing class I SAM-dependent RNA methyltransferase n=1 Tax=Fibrobacter sp. UWEL TaxID=1896209 RepID=UPI00091811A8|nr:hypothetical protein [Fibrobacter sp. UWEL]SHK46110.1 putative N6-adenine-specific DNA methylase [Fibrobacter sp. UWEL]